MPSEDCFGAKLKVGDKVKRIENYRSYDREFKTRIAIITRILSNGGIELQGSGVLWAPWFFERQPDYKQGMRYVYLD